jgi:hypothetical protein
MITWSQEGNSLARKAEVAQIAAKPLWQVTSNSPIHSGDYSHCYVKPRKINASVMLDAALGCNPSCNCDFTATLPNYLNRVKVWRPQASEKHYKTFKEYCKITLHTIRFCFMLSILCGYWSYKLSKSTNILEIS